MFAAVKVLRRIDACFPRTLLSCLSEVVVSCGVFRTLLELRLNKS